MPDSVVRLNYRPNNGSEVVVEDRGDHLETSIRSDQKTVSLYLAIPKGTDLGILLNGKWLDNVYEIVNPKEES